MKKKEEKKKLNGQGKNARDIAKKPTQWEIL
jgi:hypothetical protein